ncbi:uncharacterized protein J3R85_006457 [Psidium guajava]|nr:uncharacterized protein J3R85_006457 [Psidium guajava]
MPARANVVVGTIVLLLHDPQAASIGARKRACAPDEVLAIGPIGVDEAAVGNPLVSVALGIGNNGAIPHHVPHVDLIPGGIVRVEIVSG